MNGPGRSLFLGAALASAFLVGTCVTPIQAQSNLATAATAGGDGYLLVSVDEFGSWADPGFGGGGDRYNPPGTNPLGPRAVGFSSGFFLFSGGTQRELLSTSTNWQNVDDGNGVMFGDDMSLTSTITTNNVVSDSSGNGVNDTSVSAFDVSGGGTDLSFDLRQQVVAGANSVSYIQQDYTVTNNASTSIDFNMVRAFDGDLVWAPLPGTVTNDEVGTATNGAGVGTFVYMQEDMPNPTGTDPGVTAVTLHSEAASIYYGGKQGVDPLDAGLPFGFGTDNQIWNAFGTPANWQNFIAGVGANTDGESGTGPPDPNGDPSQDAFIGLEFFFSLAAGESSSFTVTHTYGDNAPFMPSDVNCDFDGDTDCDIDDIDALVMEIVAGTNDPSFDLTGDSLVDAADLDQWRTDAGAMNLPSGNAYLEADFNLDGSVDGTDFIEWNNNKFAASGKWSLGDANADGATDGQDFILWNQNKFMSADGVAVPEPTSAVLLLVGLLAATRRRR